MSRLEDTLRRDLQQIADRATPSPDAWASILTRIADQEPIQETEVIMLTENTIRTRRWPLVAAAAAIVALIVGVIAVVNRGDGTTVPADELPAPPTVAPTPETVAPVPEPSALPAQGEALPAGRYTADQLGTTVTFTVPAGGSPFQVDLSNPVAFSIKNQNGWVGFERIGSFSDATQALDPDVTGLGNIPPDDIDAWIEANGVIVEASRDVTVGGRPAKFRQVRLPDGVSRLNLNTISADQLDINPGSGSQLASIYANAYWFVQLDDYEPLGIWAYAYGPDLQSWLDELAPLIDSITLGDPAPAVEGGTARLSTFPAGAIAPPTT